METHYIYFTILAASLVGPLVLSFDKKVAFRRKWKFIFPAMVIPALLYIAWDMYFVKKNVWSFNPDYITGIRIGNLPVEEVLFFFVVPYCCMFIYECLRVYFRNLRGKKQYDIILKIMGAVLLLAGLVFYKKMYSSWTFIGNALFIFLLYWRREYFRHFDATAFIIAYSIILIPFLVVNGYLTSIPVVLYNDSENLGIRISTIPFEDVFYGMLLIMMNVAIYERLKSRKRTKTTHHLHHSRHTTTQSHK